MRYDESSIERLFQEDFWQVPLPDYPSARLRVSAILLITTIFGLGVLGLIYFRALSAAVSAPSTRRRAATNTLAKEPKGGLYHVLLALVGFVVTWGALLVRLSPYHVFAGRATFEVHRLFSNEECLEIKQQFYASGNSSELINWNQTQQAWISQLLDARLARVVAAVYGVPIESIQATSLAISNTTSRDSGDSDGIDLSLSEAVPSQIAFWVSLDENVDLPRGSLYLYPSLPVTEDAVNHQLQSSQPFQPKSKMVGSLVFQSQISQDRGDSDIVHPLATWLNLNWLATHLRQEGQRLLQNQEEEDPRLQEIYGLVAHAIAQVGDWFQPHTQHTLLWTEEDAIHLRDWLDRLFRVESHGKQRTRASWFPSETIQDTCGIANNQSIPLDLPDSPAIWHAGDLQRAFERITRIYPQVNVLSRDPWIVAIDDFLTVAETDRLIHWGHHYGYERSYGIGQVVNENTHEAKGVVSADRTSKNIWCQQECFEDPIVQGIFDKLESLTGIPMENAEAIQLLKYEVGEFYRMHNDYSDHERVAPEGPRILTVFLYLNNVQKGGETGFDHNNLKVYPKQGRIVLWPSVLDNLPLDRDDRTDHEAMPVLEGRKYGANVWYHLRNVAQTVVVD